MARPAYYLYVIDSTGAIFQLDIGNIGNNDGNGFRSRRTRTDHDHRDRARAGQPRRSSGRRRSRSAPPRAVLIADPGNNRIAQIDTDDEPGRRSRPTPRASRSSGSRSRVRAVYATSTAGQIYYISAPVQPRLSFGLTTGATADGPVGPISSLTPASNLTLAPTVYALQGKAGAFFDNTTNFTALAGAAYSVRPRRALSPYTQRRSRARRCSRRP